jgi:hypothetical protein
MLIERFGIRLIIHGNVMAWRRLPETVEQNESHIVTGWQGRYLTMKSSEKVVAATIRELHGQALTILNKDR